MADEGQEVFLYGRCDCGFIKTSPYRKGDERSYQRAVSFIEVAHANGFNGADADCKKHPQIDNPN